MKLQFTEIAAVSNTALLAIACSVLFLGCATGPLATNSSNTPLGSEYNFDSVRFQDEGSGQRTEPDLFSKQDDKERLAAESDENSIVGDPSQRVLEVRVTGNQRIPTHQIMRHVRTRPGRFFDPDIMQQDVDQLWRHSAIRRVKGPFLERTDKGIIIEIQVEERPYVHEVKFIGNRAITDRKLREETGIQPGRPLDIHAVRMAKQRIEDLYREQGFARTQVQLVEGNEANDQDVVFLIHEDIRQKIFRVTFEGNTVASSARLGSFVKSKAGILWLFGGNLNRDEVDQDIVRLTSYYRNLGYFNARIGREIKENQNGSWVRIHYVIDEGPRYRIRNISFVGNEFHNDEVLFDAISLKSEDGQMPFFNAAKMNRDVSDLVDTYGTKGFVFADVQAEPRFLEEPGLLDLVYRIDEGERYRVGDINVVINGDYGITKKKVVLERLDLRPGDWLDTRKLRAAEGLLRRSQLFSDGSGSSPGPPPKITIRPPEMDGNGSGVRR